VDHDGCRYRFCVRNSIMASYLRNFATYRSKAQISLRPDRSSF
jgi:hypothetical protein